MESSFIIENIFLYQIINILDSLYKKQLTAYHNNWALFSKAF